MLPLHKRLLTILTVMLVVVLGIYWGILRPVKQANAEQRTANEDRIRDLRKGGYSLEPVQLEKSRQILQQRESMLQELLTDVYDESMAQFQEGIQMYETVVGLRRGITQLDYQEIYARVRKNLAGQGIFLEEDVLGLSEQSTAGDNTYRLVVHMWVVEDLAELIIKHQLDANDYSFIRSPESDLKENEWPAGLTVQPVRLYAVSSGEAALLEEYPVKVVVRGKLEPVTAFIADLTNDQRFLPLDRAAIERIPGKDPNENLVQATLTCSGFLINRDKSEFRVNVQTEQRHNVPTVTRGM